jgi:antitoxin component YwqK of YwqJK toxin-antitoxin module
MIFLPLRSQDQGKKPKIKSLVVTEEKYNMLVKKQFTESETYYDQEGRILEDISYKQGNVDKHFKYQYDADGNKIREEEFDPSGKLIEFSEYVIKNGVRVEKTVYDSNNKIKSKKYYIYTTY